MKYFFPYLIRIGNNYFSVIHVFIGTYHLHSLVISDIVI